MRKSFCLDNNCNKWYGSEIQLGLGISMDSTGFSNKGVTKQQSLSNPGTGENQTNQHTLKKESSQRRSRERQKYRQIGKWIVALQIPARLPDIMVRKHTIAFEQMVWWGDRIIKQCTININCNSDKCYKWDIQDTMRIVDRTFDLVRKVMEVFLERAILMLKSEGRLKIRRKEKRRIFRWKNFKVQNTYGQSGIWGNSQNRERSPDG